MLSLLLACSHEPTPPAAPPTEPARPPDVLFVVLDTARADHLSACGYSRPTSPTLERLVSEGASIRCDVVSSGDWTLPSHASFFTGLPVERHGAHSLPETGNPLLGVLRIRPLGATAPTLAEHFADEGYTTAMLSGNPVVGKESGMFRGFQIGGSAQAMGDLSGDAMLGAVDDVLERADPDAPLFLFVNIADAHQPWDAIPDGLDWVAPQPVQFPYIEAVYTGQLQGAMLQEHLRRSTDGYDYGLHRADQVLDGILSRVEAARGAPGRLLVVSDHGEFLGEHGLVDHGRYLWEPNQRVFALTSPPIELPADLPSLHAFHLARDGALPSSLEPATSIAFPDLMWSKRSGGTLGVHTSVARWEGSQKLSWMDGACARVDLETDPDELAPTPTDCEPLADLVAAAQASAALPVDADPALLERLKAAGYVE